jgi:hypothetical protein
MYVGASAIALVAVGHILGGGAEEYGPKYTLITKALAFTAFKLFQLLNKRSCAISARQKPGYKSLSR